MRIRVFLECFSPHICAPPRLARLVFWHPPAAATLSTRPSAGLPESRRGCPQTLPAQAPRHRTCHIPETSFQPGSGLASTAPTVCVRNLTSTPLLEQARVPQTLLRPEHPHLMAACSGRFTRGTSAARMVRYSKKPRCHRVRRHTSCRLAAAPQANRQRVRHGADRPVATAWTTPASPFEPTAMDQLSRALLETGFPGERAQRHDFYSEVETSHEFSGFHAKPGRFLFADSRHRIRLQNLTENRQRICPLRISTLHRPPKVISAGIAVLKSRVYQKSQSSRFLNVTPSRH